MKKILLFTVITVLMAAVTQAAEGSKVNSKVVSNFFSEFGYAKNVNWTLTEDYLKASFTLNDKNMEAYYDRDGNMIGTSSSMSIDLLPTKAKRFFAKKYADYIVKEVIQFDGTDETAYYISAEDEDTWLVLKVSKEGFFSVFKNEKK